VRGLLARIGDRDDRVSACHPTVENVESRAVSGTYAEPGTQTFHSNGRRDQVTAQCRNCGYDIVFFDGSDGADWRHLVTGDHQCVGEK